MKLPKKKTPAKKPRLHKVAESQDDNNIVLDLGSGYGAVEDSVDDDTNSLLQDDVLRGFRLFNNLVNGVDHDDADDADEEYYNIRCDPDESIADFNRRT